MDIIAAHQQGLIEQIDDNAKALAGRAGDFGQRAVVLHHLFDHSRGANSWALAEARRQLRIAAAIAALRRRFDRWGWLIRRRDIARAALDGLAVALGKASQARCITAYRAYRLSATPALRPEAEQTLSGELLDELEHCHAARRAGVSIASERLEALIELHAAAAVDHDELTAAWEAVRATGLRRVVHRLLGDKAMARSMARDRKRGWPAIERELRNDPLLPASFRANPAQHFYALQHGLAERRRQQWREECDREPDAFGLAA